MNVFRVDRSCFLVVLVVFSRLLLALPAIPTGPDKNPERKRLPDPDDMEGIGGEALPFGVINITPLK